MTRSLLLACLVLGTLPLALPARAEPSTSQQRMATCSAQNKGKTGDDYKTSQKACLSGTAAAKPATPQERMKSCNADAATKKLAGDVRKTFMSSCLKKT